MVGENSFLYGYSCCNIWIESWWCILRREVSGYWIELFVKLKMDGDFDGLFLDVNIL